AATLCFSRTGSRGGFSTFMAWCTPLLTDGNIISKGSYSQNEKDGEWIIYFETDNKYYRKGLYKNGKKQGVWGLYLADNTLINEEKFINGELDDTFVPSVKMAYAGAGLCPNPKKLRGLCGMVGD